MKDGGVTLEMCMWIFVKVLLDRVCSYSSSLVEAFSFR
jgi:hypothetical protein